MMDRQWARKEKLDGVERRPVMPMGRRNYRKRTALLTEVARHGHVRKAVRNRGEANGDDVTVGLKRGAARAVVQWAEGCPRCPALAKHAVERAVCVQSRQQKVVLRRLAVGSPDGDDLTDRRRTRLNS